MSRWAHTDKPSFADRIRRTIRPPPSLKSRIELAQRKLQEQIARLDTVYTKLRTKDETIFKRVVAALQEHDTQYATVLSSELSQIRKISKMVGHSKLALEQIHIRLSTITELGDVVVALSPAMAVVKNVRSGLNGMMPEVDGEMEEISQLLSGILVESSQVPGSSIAYANSTTDSEAQSILEEAASLVEGNVKDRIPDLPLTMKEKPAEPAEDRQPEPA